MTPEMRIDTRVSVLTLSGGILTVMADEWRIRHKDENVIS
jgi:hypothetical protein